MARVLVTTFSHLIGAPLEAFRESFLDALVAGGNDVLLMRTEDFMRNHFLSNELAGDVDEAGLNDEIRQFAPEAVVSFNHSGIYPSLLEATDAPVGIWLVDGPAYLVDKEGFEQHADRVHSFIPARSFEAELRGVYGVPASGVSWLPFCSDFQAREVEQTVPISFVGTFFHRVRFPERVWRHHGPGDTWRRMAAMVASYRDDPVTPFEERLARHRLEHVFDDPFDEAGVLNTLSLNRRLHVLDRLADLGLEIYGNRNWLDALHYSMDLVLAFQPGAVETRRELEDLYNRSKIAISISHIQARGGLPWRVFDALATNCVLVSDQQEDLAELFPGLSLPTYETPEEARDLCTRLLADDAWRAEVALAGREAVQVGHRFRDRLHRMGEVLGVNLVPGEAEMGSLTRLDPRDHGRAGRGERGALPQHEGTEWPLRVWYSEEDEFSDSRLQVEVCRVVPGGTVEAVARIPEAPAYLRVGLGDYFSVHEDPALRIRRRGEASGEDPGEEEVEVDLQHGVIRVRQFKFIRGKGGARLVCGNHAWVVFQNPFLGEEVEVCFTSRLERLL
ncbi:MAG: glycosyltransferase family 1 protein [Actinobacteria bacterium]|nr:glycosyltransferase family 1 protein [Actinomycetota bacterium]